MGPVTSALTSKAYREVEDENGITWRVRLLDPALAVEARALFELVMSCYQAEPAGAPEGRKAPDRAAEARAAEMLGRVLGACVVGAKAPEADFEPIQIVSRLEEQDGARGRVWFGSMSDRLRARLFAEALALVLEARRALRPFRVPAPDPGAPGPDGEEVRPDAP